MNKLITIGAGVVLLIGGGLYALSNQNQKDSAMKAEESMMKASESMMKEDAPMMEKKDGEAMENDENAMMKSGSYESYSPEKVAAATGDIVLFFHASWCPTCREVDGDIKMNLKNVPSGLTILSVDYDNSTALKQKYGVTYQHTFVQVDTQGNQIKKWSGSSTLEALVAEVK